MRKWKPKEEEAYFYIEFEYADMTGKAEIFIEYWEDLRRADFDRLKVGNCFKTKKGAKDKLKLLKEMLAANSN